MATPPSTGLAPPVIPQRPATSGDAEDRLHDNDDDLPQSHSHHHPHLHGFDHENNAYASATRWRHQESSAFARHAAPRELASPRSTNDLSAFINSSRVEPELSNARSGTNTHQPIEVPEEAMDAAPRDPTEVRCGPLLNYRGMSNGSWLGSVLVITCGGGLTPGPPPRLILTAAGEMGGSSQSVDVQANCLFSDPRCTFWQFSIKVPLFNFEMKWEYGIPGLHAQGQNTLPARSFYVPAASECMRTMFYSCNGFSIGTDEEAWSGIALWNDVLRRHQEVPIHVMVGGGDQIYNDSIRIDGPLREWTSISNPKKRRDHDFSESFRRQCDRYYLENYIEWYCKPEFALVNSQVPQLNIWDDHDIIDGYGSYVDSFMRCDMFKGIGGCAYKYYMLFQHHLPPPRYSYSTEQGDPEVQVANTYVAPETELPSIYIKGVKHGPYINELAYHLYAPLGPRMAIMGLDARTERTRHQVNYPETYELLFTRLRQNLAAAQAAGTPVKHLLFLLGIPIAYPRLTWLENIFRSPVIAPIKLLNRRFGVGGSVFNQFDGSIDLLDDLDDHYTAKTHKVERREMLERLQAVAAEFSVRVTILGGDVHLAALGRFYSNPALKIPVERDFRFMQNIVSSAIVNKPPPQTVANLLAKRNKIHHLNADTDETMLDLFDRDPGSTARTSKSNHCMMPSRNFSIITENSPLSRAGENDTGGVPEAQVASAETQFAGADGHGPMCAQEAGAGSAHKAAGAATHGKGTDGSLDVMIRVEREQSDKTGQTCPYGLTIPLLEYSGPVPQVWDTVFPSSEPPHEGVLHSHGHHGHEPKGESERAGSC